MTKTMEAALDVTMHAAYIRTLQELHATEQCLLDALCTWRRAASGPAATLFSLHLDHTRTQAVRLAGVLHRLGAPLGNASCGAVKDLLREARAAIAAWPSGPRCNAALVTITRRIELYQRLQYEAACQYARTLQDDDNLGVLVLALEDERAAQYLVQYLSGRASMPSAS